MYLIVITVLFGAVLYFQTQPRYYTDGWFHRRLSLYVGLSAYGILPTLHWVWMNGGIQADVVQVGESIIVFWRGGEDIRGTVVARWTAGQQVEQLILHQGHDL